LVGRTGEGIEVLFSVKGHLGKKRTNERTFLGKISVGALGDNKKKSELRGLGGLSRLGLHREKSLSEWDAWGRTRGRKKRRVHKGGGEGVLGALGARNHTEGEPSEVGPLIFCVGDFQQGRCEIGALSGN